MKPLISVSIFLSVLLSNLSGQIISNPSYGLKSHSTLEIVSVEFKPDVTIINLTVENRAVAGSFCVDRNTFLVLPDRSRLKLITATGIPFCPNTHTFKRVGEILAFSLQFPSVSVNPEWFDLIEECSDNCFSVYGITLNEKLNAEIENAYKIADSGKSGEAADAFISIISSMGDSGHGILGSLYSSAIVMYLRSADEASAKKWYGKMINSGAPALKLYIENLSSRDIKW